ncbi:hypothetical protein ACELLULO517_16015 [Acidisoma cellulosilytica]|uniref:Uncharacterized protein n=1 Tax=Acidisoma cellulosilyticum TaxID=2802395 RepID=A0A963Z2U9_9PROT|nr:hypothetical protein [Acidisoma cellulosilyticum]MCB8881755.1 hypothetical protein [Acidisoma cellulosilyticum]
MLACVLAKAAYTGFRHSARPFNGLLPLVIIDPSLVQGGLFFYSQSYLKQDESADWAMMGGKRFREFSAKPDASIAAVAKTAALQSLVLG